jgi:hypothetical protein
LFYRVQGYFSILNDDSEVVDVSLLEMAFGCLEEERLVLKALQDCVYDCSVKLDVLLSFVWCGDEKVVHVDKNILQPSV